MDNVGFVRADYRDGRVHIGGKSYPAGTFATHLLNQYYENDTAARLSVFRMQNWRVSDMLSTGYLNVPALATAGAEIGYLLDNLPLLKPFDMLDIGAERNRIQALFTEDNGDFIADYFRRRGKVGQIDIGAATLDVLPSEYDKELFRKAQANLDEITAVLRFYDSIGDDVQKAYERLISFVQRVDEAERFDEAHLLPLAIEVFGQAPFPIKTEYVSICKTRNSKGLVTARRLYFESYYSFIVTDFFEGLHYGHYPKQCGICKKYFLMESAAKQKYCNGYAPFLLKGKSITCRKYAARQKRKETAEGNPVTRIYNNRCAGIRMDSRRGKLSPEDMQKALALAKKHMQLAKQDNDYANGQYAVDMSHDTLYADAGIKLK